MACIYGDLGRALPREPSRQRREIHRRSMQHEESVHRQRLIDAFTATGSATISPRSTARTSRALSEAKAPVWLMKAAVGRAGAQADRRHGTPVAPLLRGRRRTRRPTPTVRKLFGDLALDEAGHSGPRRTGWIQRAGGLGRAGRRGCERAPHVRPPDRPARASPASWTGRCPRLRPSSPPPSRPTAPGMRCPGRYSPPQSAPASAWALPRHSRTTARSAGAAIRWYAAARCGHHDRRRAASATRCRS
jgi:hypothetical protein